MSLHSKQKNAIQEKKESYVTGQEMHRHGNLKPWNGLDWKGP